MLTRVLAVLALLLIPATASAIYVENTNPQVAYNLGYCYGANGWPNSGPAVVGEKVYVPVLTNENMSGVVCATSSTSSGSRNVRIAVLDEGNWTISPAVDTFDPSCCDGHEQPNLTADPNGILRITYAPVFASTATTPGDSSTIQNGPLLKVGASAGVLPTAAGPRFRLTMKGAFSEATCVYTTNGTMHCVGQHQRAASNPTRIGFELDYYKQTSAGVETAVQLVKDGSNTGTGSPGCQPNISATGSKIAITFGKVNSDCGGNYTNLHYIESTDDGANFCNAFGANCFAAATGLTSATSDFPNHRAYAGGVSLGFQSGRCADDTPFVVFRTPSSGMLFRKASGGNWNTGSTVSAALEIGGAALSLAMVVLPDGTILVYAPLSVGSDGGDIKEWKSTNCGTSWTSTTIFTRQSNESNQRIGAKYVSNLAGKQRVLLLWNQRFPQGSTNVATTVRFMDRPQSASPGTPPPSGPVVQYRINEASSGQAPTQVLDAEASPLHLTNTYGSQPVYYSETTGKGLDWGTLRGAGGASVAVDGTKVKTHVHGATKAALVAVADLVDVTPLTGAETPWRLALAPASNTSMSVIVNGVGVVWTGLTITGRHVYHVNIDTNQASSTNRVRLFMDGVDLGNANSGTLPSQGATIDLQTGRRLNIGNNDIPLTNSQSIRGRISYAAIYATTLATTEILSDATALLTDDDTGGITPGAPLPNSVVYVGNGAWQTSSTQPVLTPGLPPTLQPTDQTVAIVTAHTSGQTPAWQFPTGWEPVASCHRAGTGEQAIALQVWKKTGTAPTSAPDITSCDVGLGHSAVLVAWRNTTGTVTGVASDNGAAQTWVPDGVTTLANNTRVASIVATGDVNQLSIQTAPAGWNDRLVGAPWNTTLGPQSIAMADFTQGSAGAVPMPTWQQELNGPDAWCGVAIALGLIAEPPPPPEPPSPPGPGGTIPRFIITNRPLAPPTGPVPPQ